VHLAVITDAYPPMRTSAAVQIRDLVAKMAAQGHQVTVLFPDCSLDHPWKLEENIRVSLLRLKAPRTKEVNYFRRALAEYRLSGCMYRNLMSSPLKTMPWDALVWYSPTIFFGSLVARLRKHKPCPSYIILRDIFPEWAVDMGLLGRGLVYRYFKKVERFQYEQADTIGVQTPSNIEYFSNQQPGLDASVQVLNNWLSESSPGECSIQFADTPLAGRRIFAYTGNIGIAQGMDILIDLAKVLKDDDTVGFVFVGRGTAVEQIRKRAQSFGLENILFFDEIDPAEIPGLLAQCHVGLIALDPRHRNDNIPGKFLAYMQAGLPVLATINAGNDLEVVINQNRVGRVITSNDVADLKLQADDLLASLATDDDCSGRCRQLAESRFSSRAAVQQIVAALKG